MEFEYDFQKSKLNFEKYGISLEEARNLWLIPFVQIPARVFDETRFMLIGKLKEKFYSCVFTVRGQKIRLISARRSRKEEESIYHENIQENES